MRGADAAQTLAADRVRTVGDVGCGRRTQSRSRLRRWCQAVRLTAGGQHPPSAVLAVAVAETTLAFDRGRKGPLRARAGIPESWMAHRLDGC